MAKLCIQLCMGSSCFSWGNGVTVQILKDYIEENNLEDRIELSGSLCLGQCSLGPNLKINDTIYNRVSPDSVVELLLKHLQEA